MVNLSSDTIEEEDLSAAGENRVEMYLNALRSFAAQQPADQQNDPSLTPSSASTHTELLDDYMKHVAATGRSLFDWPTIRAYFLHKLQEVMKDMRATVPYNETTPQPNTDHFNGQTYMERISVAVEAFDGIPFTIQRLAELLTNPKKHYKRADKFFRALEKNVTIVTTVGPDGDRDVTSYATVGLLNGKSSEETVMLSNNGDDVAMTSPAALSSNGSMGNDEEELLQHDRGETTVATTPPRPMPSIETLWETTAVAATRRLSADDDMLLSGNCDHAVAADTSIDNLRPSIGPECLIDATDDILVKESFWPVASSTSVGSSVSVKYPSDQFVTMTPLQVPQLSSSSPTNNADANLLTETSTSTSSVFCTLPSVGLTFGDFDEDPTGLCSLGDRAHENNNNNNNRECSTEVTTTTNASVENVSARIVDNVGVDETFPMTSSSTSPSSSSALVQSSIEIFVTGATSQEMLHLRDLPESTSANIAATSEIKGFYVEADSTDPICSTSDMDEPPRKIARLSRDEESVEGHVSGECAEEIPLPVSSESYQQEVQDNNVEDKAEN